MTRLGVCLSVCAFVLMGLASTARAGPGYVRPHVFTAPSQPLDVALRRLADQGKVQILFSGEMVRGRTSASVRGVSDIGQAFACALKPAGLTVRQVNARTFIVVALPANVPAMAPVSVESDVSEPIPEVLVMGARRGLRKDRSLTASREDIVSVNAISILSRTTLERQPARTVSEALGVLPGMTVLTTGQSFIGGVDSASRAEGMFSAFRGLNTEFNLNMVNGVSLAQGLPYSRGVQLSLLPPSQFQSIVLHKTPRPDMDGDVVGAAVDFRTPNAFDFAGRSHFAFSLSGTNNSRAQAYGADDAGEGFSVEFARKFGAQDQFGLYAATYFERRVFANSAMSGIMSAQNDDGWAYLVSDAPTGTNPAGTNPQDNITLTSLNVGISTGENLSRSHVLSLDWRPGDDLSLYLRATSAVTRTSQNSTHSQFVGRDPSWVDDGTGDYRLSVGSISTRVWYETNPDYASLSSYALGAEKRIGNWTLSPSVFFSQGESNRPNHIEASVRVDQVDDYNAGVRHPFSGLSILYDSHGWPVPQFTPETYDDFENANTRLLARRAGQLIAQFSRQTRQGAQFDATFQPDSGALTRLQFGLKYILSQRQITDRDWTNAYFGDIYGQAGLTWDDLGITTGYYAAAFPGRYDWRLPKVDQTKLIDYFQLYQTAASFDSCGALYVNNLNCNTQHGQESVAAAYVSAVFRTDRFEWAPGLRFEQTRIDNTYWVMPPPPASTDEAEVAGHWELNHSAYTQLLPSLQVNYRPDEERVYRLSIWRAYARPSLFELGGGVRYDTSDDGTPVLRRGNPDLKMVEATNVDLSVEGHFRGTGFTLGAYYKGLEHYLYDNWTSGAGVPGQTGDLRVVIPQNGGRAQVKGLELEGHRSWAMPAGVLDLSLNLSRQWTVVDLGQDTFGHKLPIQNAPDWLANAIIGYTLKSLDVKLMFNHTGAYISDYNILDAPGDWDNTWVRPSSRLDLEAGWQIDDHARLDASVTNLGGGYSYWGHVGKDSLNISDIINAGRQARLTLRYQY